MKLFKDIYAAIIGVEQDYTYVKLSRAIVLLAIPMVFEMIFESLFAIWDIFLVSQLGDNATSVVGITESIMTLIYAIGMGIAMGTTALVSRRIGEKKHGLASIAASQAILMSLLLSLIIAVPGWLYPDKILKFMNAEAAVISEGQNYTQLMLSSNILIILLFINNATFRSAGNPALSMWVLILANIINIILDPCFIFGWGPFPKLGVTGAAVATITGRGVAVLLQFYLLFSGKGRIKILLSYFRIRLKVMWKIFYLSFGGIIQFLIATTSWIFLYRILSKYNTEIVAGYTIGIRLFVFFLLPAWGLSNATSTLVGQNLGAQKPERAQKAVRYTALTNAAYMFVIMLLFLLIPNIFVNFFGTSPLSYDVAIRCMKIVSLGNIFYGIQMVLGQAFNGAGDTYTPTLLNFIAFWLIEIPLAYILAVYWKWEENGVFYSICISETLLSLISIWIFSLGKWKNRKV